MLACVLVPLLLSLVPQTAAPASPFDPSRWNILDPEARAVSYLGRPSLFLDNGVALLKESSFADGTLEVDVAMHGHPSFAGLAFRAEGRDDYELVYLRPHLSRQPDALQYMPFFNGFGAWQLYNGPGFTAAAELPTNRWVHLRLVVSGYSARLFVDNAAEPQLVVSSLKRPWAHGQVGVWGGLGGANFSNFKVTPADTAAPPVPVERPADHLLVDWELSPAWETPKVPDDALPASRAGWTPARAEGSGILNIARYRHGARNDTSPKTSRDLVFARTTITSVQPRRARLVFAYSDAIHIFLNGRLLFAGESAFRSRDASFLGIASLGPDAIYVDLAPGSNELVFAITETFGGWGFAARLEPLGPELGLDRK
jgi:hypothetical protein